MIWTLPPAEVPREWWQTREFSPMFMSFQPHFVSFNFKLGMSEWHLWGWPGNYSGDIKWTVPLSRFLWEKMKALGTRRGRKEELFRLWENRPNMEKAAKNRSSDSVIAGRKDSPLAHNTQICHVRQSSAFAEWLSHNWHNKRIVCSRFEWLFGTWLQIRGWEGSSDVSVSIFFSFESFFVPFWFTSRKNLWHLAEFAMSLKAAVRFHILEGRKIGRWKMVDRLIF